MLREDIKYLRMRLIWEVEKVARSMPHWTARRASRLSWLRLFLTSKSSSLMLSCSWDLASAGALDNLSPFDSYWTSRRAEWTVAKDSRREYILLATHGGDENKKWCTAQPQQCFCTIDGHCRRARTIWLMVDVHQFTADTGTINWRSPVRPWSIGSAQINRLGPSTYLLLLTLFTCHNSHFVYIKYEYICKVS